MAKLNLDAGAKYLLHTFQGQSKPITAQVEQKIAQACEAKGEQALSAKELSSLLLQAMPEQKKALQVAEKACASSGYHADGKNADFLTQFVGVHSIEKERAQAVQPQRTWATGRFTRDPLDVKVVMDNDAKSMLLFNGRDVDQNGRPLLMSAVLRVSDPTDAEKTKAEVEAFKKEMGGFEIYRSHWGAGAVDADIKVVAKDDAYVAVKDLHEQEFAFGDPLLQVSLAASGKELSRGVAISPENKQITKYYAANADGTPNLGTPVRSGWNTGNLEDVATGHSLDNTPPAIFDQRIQLTVKANANFPEGAWLDAKGAAIDMQMFIEPGLVFEPNKTATVSFLGQTLTTGVEKNDAFFTGSPATEKGIPLDGTYGNHNLGQLLRQNVTRSVVSQENPGVQDQASASFAAVDLVYKQAANIKIASQGFTPLGDVPLKKAQLGDATGVRATMTPAPDENNDATNVHLRLDKGFLKSENDTSIAGWKVVVGFRDHDGSWKQCKEATVKSADVSQGMEFNLGTDNAPALMKKGASLEIRIFNDSGVPAERVLVPFQAMSWDKTVVDGGTPTQQA